MAIAYAIPPKAGIEPPVSSIAGILVGPFLIVSGTDFAGMTAKRNAIVVSYGEDNRIRH